MLWSCGCYCWRFWWGGRLAWAGLAQNACISSELEPVAGVFRFPARGKPAWSNLMSPYEEGLAHIKGLGMIDPKQTSSSVHIETRILVLESKKGENEARKRISQDSHLIRFSLKWFCITTRSLGSLFDWSSCMAVSGFDTSSTKALRGSEIYKKSTKN